MTKQETEQLVNQYIADGFDKIDFELTDNRVISFMKSKHNCVFNKSAVWIGGDGLIISIDYAIIKSIAL